MNERLAVHLLKRLRREAMKLALADAVETGILRQEYVESLGAALGVYRRCPETTRGMSPEQAVSILSRHRRRLPTETPHPVLGSRDLPLNPGHDGCAAQVRASENAKPQEVPLSAHVRAGDVAMVRAIRAAAEPPRASDVATVLLLADAVRADGAALAIVLQALRLRRPIAAILCEIQGFERNFLSLLRRGILLPGVVACSDGYDSLEAFRFQGASNARWRAITFVGRDHENDSEPQLSKAARSDFPLLAVAEKIERLAAKLVQASQLDLECGMLNAAIVRRTIETVLCATPSDGKLDGINFHLLDLGDLALAIRPGITADAAAEVLRRLAEPAGDKVSGSETSVDTPEKKKSRSSSSSTARRGTDPGSGSDIIAPTEPSDLSGGQSVPTIETLAGYGEASAWASQIRDELPQWLAGKLAWVNMSTKILLYGPPGVGKTLFARALCNTLQIPLLATSVARWLEPSHLGDVLKRIRRAFAEAEAHSPCILFVDEFDGIGRRVAFETREYADYWNSIVNCGLEMLDGAVRTSGVIIVCATNDPSAIDPALLRSGRIERQIGIPLPDANARLTILQHHLGDDVGAIAASVPPPTGADLHKTLREGFAMMSDEPYRNLVAAAIPTRTEADAA